jgi:predicted metal-dependent enzyme (double-stranded beta helix superfamily)
MTKTSLAPGTNELPKLADLLTEMALRGAARFLVRLVEDPAFLENEILPVLRDAQGAKEWYVARRYAAEDGSYSLQIFAWPPGTKTKIHDHSSWGPTVASWAPWSRSATSASTTAPYPTTPV